MCHGAIQLGFREVVLIKAHPSQYLIKTLLQIWLKIVELFPPPSCESQD